MRAELSERKYVVNIIFIVVAAILILRLFFIQVVTDEYKLSAKSNVLRPITVFPDRGLILDRKGRPLVENEASYDLMMIPRFLKNADTSEIANILGLDYKDVRKRMQKAKAYSSYRSSILEKHISKIVLGALQEKLYKYKGLFIQRRTVRRYPRAIAAHLLGYLGEVSQNTVDKNKYYKSGDYIGISGIEKSYEEVLRGKKGLKIMMVDVFNQEKGSFSNGQFDTAAVSGTNLITTVDADLQEYGEKLMQNKKGSIVAIEPATGELLAVVTSVGYDPNTFRENYQKLIRDNEMKPLLNRALTATYPPGSTFKLLNALIGQQFGVLTPNTRFPCSKGFHIAGLTVRCHQHAAPLDLRESIQQSCNSYYCNAFVNMLNRSGYKTIKQAYKAWREIALSFNFGKKFNNDLPNELTGNIPTAEVYDGKYNGHWNAISIISISIGQGEILVTPLQLANFAAILANRGTFFIPHVVKAIGKLKYIDKKFTTPIQTLVDRKYFDIVVDGMSDVIESGTGRSAKIDGIEMCGKTGTAQNPHGDDHSIFLMFAPKEKPKIALCVIVENAGFGATWAAPIASLMTEKYLYGKIKRYEMEKNMLEGTLIPTKKKENVPD